MKPYWHGGNSQVLIFRDSNRCPFFFGGSMAPLTLLFFLPAFSSVFSTYLSSTLSTMPRQFLYSLTNESNTQTEGTPTPHVAEVSKIKMHPL